MDILPPAYQIPEPTGIAPPYSTSPRDSDIILPSDPHTFLDSPRCTNFNWRFKTSHMLIDFGPRIWGLRHPAYGLDGTIRFSVELNGVEGKDEELTATLEGYMESTTSRRMVFLSQDIAMTLSSPARSQSVKEFSIEIPSTITMQDVTTPMPPTFMLYDFAGTACDIKYQVKIVLTGLHGIRVKHDETKIVPIVYLPKSQPPSPPLLQLRRPLQGRDGVIVCPEFQNSERTKTFALCPKFTSPSSPSENDFRDSVFLTLPSPLSFSTGQKIPYLFSLVFPSHPHLNTLYTHARIDVAVMKQLTVSHHKRRLPRMVFKTRGTVDSPVADHPYRTEWLVAFNSPKYHSEYNEGVSVLRGCIETGEAGTQCSWRLGNYASIRYVLRVTVHPPEHFAGALPSFTHEVPLELSTDQWGTLQRELSSMGGVPTPALGLTKNQCPDTASNDARLWIY
ncbi:hypothetical protein V5O48_007373 [Marasmius crinis-equi]|uniref:Arrestin-like N-terminal domain-containing protein n=1 Tax=Marasmius crinis-equi TaxID=585013 RepID=A0ABR3FGW6_9AGAR